MSGETGRNVCWHQTFWRQMHTAAGGCRFRNREFFTRVGFSCWPAESLLRCEWVRCELCVSLDGSQALANGMVSNVRDGCVQKSTRTVATVARVLVPLISNGKC